MDHVDKMKSEKGEQEKPNNLALDVKEQEMAVDLTVKNRLQIPKCYRFGIEILNKQYCTHNTIKSG